MIDDAEKPFYDPEADEALIKAIEETFIATNKRKLIKLPYHINDQAFADAVVQNFKEIIRKGVNYKQ